MQVSATPTDPPLPGNCPGQQRQVGWCCCWGPFTAFKESPAASPSPRLGLLACLARQQAPNNCETLLVLTTAAVAGPKSRSIGTSLALACRMLHRYTVVGTGSCSCSPPETHLDTTGVSLHNCSSCSTKFPVPPRLPRGRVSDCGHASIPGCCLLDSSFLSACQAVSQLVLQASTPAPQHTLVLHLCPQSMYISEWSEGKGWDQGALKPYGPLQLMPSAQVCAGSSSAQPCWGKPWLGQGLLQNLHHHVCWHCMCA